MKLGRINEYEYLVTEIGDIIVDRIKVLNTSKYFPSLVTDNLLRQLVVHEVVIEALEEDIQFHKDYPTLLLTIPNSEFETYGITSLIKDTKIAIGIASNDEGGIIYNIIEI